MVNPENVTAALFHVCVIVLGVDVEIVPAANVAVVSVGALERTFDPVPVFVAHDRTPLPLVISPWLAEPSPEGSVQMRLLAIESGALNPT